MIFNCDPYLPSSLFYEPMLSLLSPAKTLDVDRLFPTPMITKPTFFEDSLELATSLRAMTATEIGELMKISDNLAQLNFQRYQDFSAFNTSHNKPALTTFRGDVYKAFNREEFTVEDYLFAQEHLGILSGLYGVLKPLDGIQPYRLEMGTKLANSRGKNLYAYWQEKVSNYLNIALQSQSQPTIVNLASQEYIKVVDQKRLSFPMITITFKEIHKGKLKVIAIKSKRARGVMANWLIKQKIDTPEQLTTFNEDDYSYQEHLSSESELVFTR